MSGGGPGAAAVRLQPPGPLPERRLRDELPDPRLPELRLTPSTPPALCAPEPRAPGPAASRGDTCALDQTHVQRIGLTSLPRLYRAARVCEQRSSGGGRPTVQEQVSRPFWNDLLSSPSYTRTPASGGAARSQPQRPRQRWRALGTAWQADADLGGPSRSPTNSDNPRVPGAPIWSRLTLALCSAQPAARRSAGRRGGGSSGEWLRAGEPSVEVTPGRH
ncbi:uncharacterized protein LOC109458416 [Rhinolophus sinicus]|uniref:uncharacterized protein LOC109458416 n=1 Tax=Rhinolophus sinicus TaxID=89399 RepID=UPI003D78C67F